jgi:hypothetical protein
LTQIGGGQHGGVGAECRLHPLIHTIASETSAQDVEKKKKGAEAPQYFLINE